VSEQPTTNVTDFKEQTKRDIDNVLRFRLKEEGMLFRYGGADLIDMRPVDWVELVDREDRTFRLAVLQRSHCRPEAWSLRGMKRRASERRK